MELSHDRSAMILLNGGAGSKGQMAYSCSYFLCSYVLMFFIAKGIEYKSREVLLQL